MPATATDTSTPEPEEHPLDRLVGERIRELRRGRGLSLNTVADRCDVSIGFLSQIERGLSSPSLRVLTALADALGVPIASLFVPPEPADTDARGNGAARRGKDRETVVRANRRAKLKLWRSGIQKQLLTPEGAGTPFTYYVMLLEPHATSGDELYSHAGEEAGLVTEGRVRLTVGEETWDLLPGDSFSFRSSRPHGFQNPSGKRARIVMVHIPG